MPKGRKSDKRWRDALTLAVLRPIDDNDPASLRKLDKIAEETVMRAMAGEEWAIVEIGNRLDGRPKQEMDLTTSPGEAFLEFLREMNDRNREPPALGPSVLEQLPKPEAVRH